MEPITFNIIRGHRLILWAERLDFQPEFISQLDKFGTHYVQQIEKTDINTYSLVVFAKLVGRDSPFPIIFTCDGEQLYSLIERVIVE